MTRFAQVPFDEALEDATGGNPKVLTSSLSSSGKYAVVDQGQQFVSGYVDDANLLYRRNGEPIILFGDHTKIIKFIDFDFVLGADGVKALKSRPGFHPRYLLHYLHCIPLPNNLGYSRHFKYLKAATVPKPPLDEQERIAAVLDKADAIRKKRRDALNLADEFLRSVFLDLFGDPAMNSKGLPKEKLGNLIKLKSGNFLPAHEMARDGEVPVYGGNGVNGYHDQHMFEDRQVVIGRVGAYCGAVHVTEAKSWITDNALFVTEKSKSIQLDYLAFALKFAHLNQYASQSGQPLVSGSRIYPVEILVPSEQDQSKFERVLRKIEKIAYRQQVSADEADQLFCSLQQQAFA